MLGIILVVPALIAQVPAHVAKARREFVRGIFVEDAAGYAIHRDASKREKVEFRREPAYLWTNPTREGGQEGSVFVWTCRGRAEVVGTIFTQPMTGPRKVIHELHSLSTGVLDVDRKSGEGWTPIKPGIAPRPLADAPKPAATPAARMGQMRTLIREFAASATDGDRQRWELRALTQPLYRYESTDPDILDGAVFTMVSSAGTDPEMMIVLEARKAPGEPATAMNWQFAGARFSDMALSVKHKDKVVYSVPVVPWDFTAAKGIDKAHRYHLLTDRTIPPVEESVPGGGEKSKP